MSHSQPDNNTLVIECDGCEHKYTFYGDEGDPVREPAKCISRAHQVGWTSKKPVGYAWENYCAECSKLPFDMRVPKSMRDDL